MAACCRAAEIMWFIKLRHLCGAKDAATCTMAVKIGCESAASARYRVLSVLVHVPPVPNENCALDLENPLAVPVCIPDMLRFITAAFAPDSSQPLAAQYPNHACRLETALLRTLPYFCQ
jgi:hypothetical protein